MSYHRIVTGLAIVLWAFGLPAYCEEPVASSAGQPSLSASSGANLPVKYIGNRESLKFHRPSCPYARIMAHSKRVQFFFRSQAVACGHIPCRYCLPPVWKVVRGRLLLPAGGVNNHNQDSHTAPP